MNQATILRQISASEILSIVETVLQSNNPSTLQLIGEAGAGKTTLLIQLNTYLENYGIFPQVIHTNADNNYSIIKSLKNYSYAHGLEEGYELDSSRSITSKHIHRYLTGLRNPRKDILIYLVDDAHHLTIETIESLRMVFDPDISSGKRLLILSGRKSNGLVNTLELANYSNEEFNEYISLILGSNWSSHYPDGVDWLESISKKHPFHLSLLLEYCVQKGFMTKNYCAPKSFLEKSKYPDDLLNAIGQKYVIDSINEQCLHLLNIIAINNSGLTTRDLSNISAMTTAMIRRKLNKLVESGWVSKIGARHYECYHPLVKEYIKQNISKESKEELHRRCLKHCHYSDAEKVQHLLEFSSLKNSEKSLMVNYANQLESQGLYYSAIQIYEKLNTAESSADYQFYIGRNFAKLYRVNKAKEFLFSLSKVEGYKYQADVHYYLGLMSVSHGESKAGLKYLRKAVKKLETKHPLWLSIHSKLVGVYAELGEEQKAKSYISELKNNSSLSDLHQLTYLHTLMMHELSFPAENFDTQNHYKAALPLAFGLGEYQKASDLEIAMMHFFHNLDQKDSINKENQHADQASEYAKKSFDLNQVLKARRAKTMVLAENEQSGMLIQNYRSIIETMKKQNLLSELPTVYASLVRDTYFIGNIKDAQKEFKNALELLKQFPETPFKPRLLLGEYLMDSGQYKEGMKILESVKNEAAKSNDAFHIHVAEGFMYPALYVIDKDKADKTHDKVNAFLKSVDMDVLIYIFAQVKVYTLLDHNDMEGFKLHQETSPEIHSDDIGLHVINFMLKGNIRATLALVREFEEAFDGSGLCYGLKVYGWLKNQKSKNHLALKRWEYIHSLIEGLSNHTEMKSPRFKGKKSPFIKLLEGWHESLMNKTSMGLIKISNFTREPQVQDKIIQAIQVWDIDVVDDEQSQAMDKSSDIPIIINLLGVPKLYLNHRRLSAKDWSNKRSLEILIYIILKGWKNEYPISLDAILRDFWNPDADNIDRCKKIRNTLMTRVRKTFRGFDEAMLVQENGTIRFNWESNQYRLDIDSFDRSITRGKEAKKHNLNDDAIRYFETAFNLYNGDIALGVDGLWIESIRIGYYNDYIYTIESLIELYDSDKSKDMIDNALKIYPNDESILELSKNL